MEQGSGSPLSESQEEQGSQGSCTPQAPVAWSPEVVVLKRVSQSQQQLLSAISAACCSAWFLGRPPLLPKTTANNLRGLTELFLSTCHWKTLYLNHNGKEISAFSSTMKKQHRSGRDDAGLTETVQKVHHTLSHS